MKNLTTGLIVALLATSAVATAGDRRDRDRDRDDDRGWRSKRIRLISADGPSLFGRRTSFFQVPPAPGPQPMPEYSAPQLTPMPEAYPPLPEGSYVLPGQPGPGAFEPGTLGPIVGDTFGLYPCVKYEDKDHIHPCAVKKIIAVKDTRPKCECGPTGCVYVAICVPEHICPEVDVDDDGREITYDFGDYKVEIESKKGTVYVDYDD